MATQDISRFLLQPNKHYSSLHLQQGRVIVDSDWNERASVEAEDLRQTVLDIVCARGTPNDGFGVALSVDPVPDAAITTPDGVHETYDFDIGGGSYYLGGLRLAVDNALDKETFLTQSDWLQVTSSDAYMPERPTPGAGAVTRIDLVYLYAWEQPITAVEDRELAEVALGARDTSTRIKRMRRFVATTVAATDCEAAFDELITTLEEAGKAEYKPETGELVSQARLQVTTTSVDAIEDPCADPTASGYVGANNQTIRVELRPGAEVGFDGKLLWGFDNASKIYRVQVDGTNVSFLTTPQDLASMPRAGQVVEFLQWGAKLPNSEKVAEMQGVVTVVTGGYNHHSKQIEIESVPELADWNTWLGLHSEHYNNEDPMEERQFLYMRIWDRGSELVNAAADALINYEVGTAVALGDTGLEVTVMADGKDGDFWIIAARPSTPEVVTPWDLNLAAGAPPHGPRRYYAPLGLISITDATPLTYVAKDCRTKLRKLCEGGACTVTVGDGKKSFGQFNDLQAAVDAVGPLSKICLLPGEHVGQTLISGANGLIIEGCGLRSVLENPSPTGVNTDFQVFQAPVISIKDSSHVFIRDLAITGYSAVGVEIAADAGTCSNIKLENLTISSTGGYETDKTGAATSWWLPASGITVAAASSVEIITCEVTMSDILSFAFAVVLGGNALSLRGCKVSAPPNARVSAALGGVNIRSGSYDVEITDCDIRGGWGHGVALGHGRVYATDEEPTRLAVLKEKVTIGSAETSVTAGEDPSGCDCEQGSSLSTERTVSTVPKFFPAGAVENVRIYDNRISGMGMSGVSTTLYWPSTVDYGTATGAPRFIVVTDIDIARNVIEENVNLELPADLFVNFDVAVGGVCLAASTNAWIHENTIRNNGTIFQSVPVCGVGMVAAMNAVVEDNQIVDNGVRAPAGDERFEKPGLRGGIAICEATAVRTKAKTVESGAEMPTFPTGSAAEVPFEGVEDWTGASSQSAVTVRGNEVSHLLGRALWIRRGFGPVVVTGNSLQSYGSPVLGDAVPGASLSWWFSDNAAGASGALLYAAAGACVEISNYGLPEDKPWPETPTPNFPTLAFVDPGQAEVYGGSVLASGNRMRLEWERHGGWPASVLVQSIGAVIFNDNVSEVVMGNEYDAFALSPLDIWEFSTAVCNQEYAHTFVMTNVFVGGRTSVSLCGNRLTEPKWDAVFSALVAYPALAVDKGLAAYVAASLAIANVGSHCIIAQPSGSTAFREHNVEIFGLTHVAGGTTYTCADIELSTQGVSDQSRLVTASMRIGS